MLVVKKLRMFYAKKLLAEFMSPMQGIPEDLPLGASIGICLFPYEGMTVSNLIHRADEAMCRVKSADKGHFSIAAVPQPVPASC